MDFTLDTHAEELLVQYYEQIPRLVKLQETAYTLLDQIIRQQGIYITAIERRLKSVESLKGKLELKGGKYARLEDITDLVGLRVITFYTHDVDKVAALVNRIFEVDWQNSVDKRKLHQLNSFGYNSLHYVCRLPKSKVDDPRMADIPFELQMRTALQHAWSTIEHDIGYKFDIQIPREYMRQFNRLAGMLELVDDEFSRLRNAVADYRRRVQGFVKSAKFNEVPFSLSTYRSFLELKPLERLNLRIAAINQAELYPASLLPFFPLLEKFGMNSLGDVQRFISDNSDDAFKLATLQLAVTDLDILSEAIGMQNLCFVHVMKQGWGVEGVKLVFDTLAPYEPSNQHLAERLVKQAAVLPFAQQSNSQTMLAEHEQPTH